MFPRPQHHLYSWFSLLRMSRSFVFDTHHPKGGYHVTLIFKRCIWWWTNTFLKISIFQKIHSSTWICGKKFLSSQIHKIEYRLTLVREHSFFQIPQDEMNLSEGILDALESLAKNSISFQKCYFTFKLSVPWVDPYFFEGFLRGPFESSSFNCSFSTCLGMRGLFLLSNMFCMWINMLLCKCTCEVVFQPDFVEPLTFRFLQD